MTLLGVQIGRTLVKNVFSVNGGGGTGDFGSDHGKHELLGRMHMDVCEGKAMKDSIRDVRQVWVIVAHLYAQTYTPTEYRGEGFKYLLCNRLQEVIHCSSFKLQPLVLIEDQKC